MQNKEVLLMIEAISNEKNIQLEDVFVVLEEALAIATKKRQGIEARVSVDRETCEFTTYQQHLVVDDDCLTVGEEEIPFSPLLHQRVSETNNLNIGDIIEAEVESIEFGRIAAQTVKQLITQKVREIERNVIVQDYEQRVGEIVITTVKRIDRGQVYVDLSGVDGLIQKNDMIANESMRKGDRIRAYIKDVRANNKGAQILLSRSSVGFLTELFKMEVPEISSQLIEIKGGARDPGLRAKLAVQAKDRRIDPVGSCIGMRGSRVQAVSNELNGERVDIILWDENPAQFVINAMAPAEISSIVMDEDNHTMEVVVDEEQLAQAIGRNGQNIRLATQVTGWKLNVMSQEQAESKQAESNKTLAHTFEEQLNIETDIAQGLVEQGLTSIDELENSSDEDLLAIKGIDATKVDNLRDKIQDAVLSQALDDDLIIDALTDIEGVDDALANALVSKNIRSQEDLADLSVDELLDIQNIDEQKAKDIIMTARAPWFK